MKCKECKKKLTEQTVAVCGAAWGCETWYCDECLEDRLEEWCCKECKKECEKMEEEYEQKSK